VTYTNFLHYRHSNVLRDMNNGNKTSVKNFGYEISCKVISKTKTNTGVIITNLIFLKLNFEAINLTDVVHHCLKAGFCDTDDEQLNLYCRGSIVWSGIYKWSLKLCGKCHHDLVQGSRDYGKHCPSYSDDATDVEM
jgi:hypothetical protein